LSSGFVALSAHVRFAPKARLSDKAWQDERQRKPRHVGRFISSTFDMDQYASQKNNEFTHLAKNQIGGSSNGSHFRT
jgi:hypothetical protein